MLSTTFLAAAEHMIVVAMTIEPVRHQNSLGARGRDLYSISHPKRILTIRSENCQKNLALCITRPKLLIS